MSNFEFVRQDENKTGNEECMASHWKMGDKVAPGSSNRRGEKTGMSIRLEHGGFRERFMLRTC